MSYLRLNPVFLLRELVIVPQSFPANQRFRPKKFATLFLYPSAPCVTCKKIFPPDGGISFFDSLYIRGTRCPLVGASAASAQNAMEKINNTPSFRSSIKNQESKIKNKKLFLHHFCTTYETVSRPHSSNPGRVQETRILSLTPCFSYA